MKKFKKLCGTAAAAQDSLFTQKLIGILCDLNFVIFLIWINKFVLINRPFRD